MKFRWSPAPPSGQNTANVTYTWVTGTPQMITVTARNANQAVVTGTHTISIEVPLTGAIITGPITVSQNISHAYSVSTRPVTATLPIDLISTRSPSATCFRRCGCAFASP